MKRTLHLATAAVVLAVVATVPAAQAATCTDASVAGTYGYTTTGMVMVPTTVSPTGTLPVAAVGTLTFDLQGNVSGTQTRVVAGTATPESLSGTYTLNATPDCTGSLTVTVDPGSRVSTLNLVWDDNTKEVRGIFTVATTILTVDARRQ